MITYVSGSLFQSPAKVLVNTVNVVGVMGKGIALEFKHVYPEMFSQYQVLCEKGQFRIGQLWLYKTSHKWILNFPTKQHWRQKSRPEYIEAGLQKFVATYAAKGITSISFPRLGCGNGELDWDNQVRPLMERYLADLPIDVYIHLYDKNDLVPEHRDLNAIRAWLRGEPQSLAFAEFWEDLIEVLGGNEVFHTLDMGVEFTVELSPALDAVVIRQSGQVVVTIPREEEGMLELWQHIRAAGYVLANNLPCGLDAYAPFVVSLLSRLDYIDPVRLARPDERQHPQIGLQLTPLTTINRNPLASMVSKPAHVVASR